MAFLSRGRAGWALFGALMASFLVPAAAVAQEKARRAPPLLLGGGIQASKSPVRLDPRLPRGEVRRSQRAPLMKSRLCSLKRPLCVASAEQLTDVELRSDLGLLERAYEEQVFGAGLSAPQASASQALVWHLAPHRPLKVSLTLIPSRSFDRARGFCLGGAHTLETARRCVVEMSLAATAPATAPWLRAGLAAEISRSRGASPVADSGLSESFRFPHMGTLTSSEAFRLWREDEMVQVSPLRSLRFFEYLNRRSERGLGRAGWLSLSLAATRTQAGASRFEAEPDLFDVLQVTLGGDVTKLARLFDDFAQDSFHQSQKEGTAIEPVWTILGESLPRNVALPFPLEPTGSAYVRVLLTPEQRAQVMAFKMSCEAPVSYVWSVARLDVEGEEQSHVPVAYRQRGRSAATRVEPEEGTHSLLVSGTNMGGIDMAHPFDPDHAPHEAHACSLYVSEMPGAASPGAEGSGRKK